MSLIEIRPISSEATLSLRHRMLRPAQPLQASRYPGDEAAATFHRGAFADGEMVGIASIYQEAMPGEPEDETSWRLRGMAVLPEHQRHGIGRVLLQNCIDELKDRNAGLLWCNGRIGAVNFYQSMGLVIRGEKFELPGIGLHYVMVLELDTASGADPVAAHLAVS